MYLKEKRKVKIKYMILTALILFLPTTVKAYNFSPSDFRIQGFEGNSWRAEAVENGNYMGYSQFPINATSNVNTLRILWDSGNVDLTTTGYNNYDLTVFDFKIYNNTLSAGVEPITQISAFGNACYYTSTRMTYASGQESMQVSAICPGAVPQTWGNLASIILINFASFTPSTVNLSNITVTATNGALENYIASLNNQMQITNGHLSTIIGILNNSGNQQVVNAINNQTNSVINYDQQGTQTNIDDTGVQGVEQQGQQQIQGIEQALQNIQAPTFDLTDFGPTFYWIWQTITYLFTTHTILMTTMIIILSLGFLKTVLGR